MGEVKFHRMSERHDVSKSCSYGETHRMIGKMVNRLCQGRLCMIYALPGQSAAPIARQSL